MSAQTNQAVHKAFKSTTPFIQMILPNGEVCQFINHLYHTDNEETTRLLMNEIGTVGKTKSRHPFIYVDEDQTEVDPEALTPMAILEKTIRAKILADMAAAEQTNNDRGNSSANFQTSINNSVDGVAQVSSDKGVLAQLDSLKQSGTQVTQQNPSAIMTALKEKIAAANAGNAATSPLGLETLDSKAN